MQELVPNTRNKHRHEYSTGDKLQYVNKHCSNSSLVPSFCAFFWRFHGGRQVANRREQFLNIVRTAAADRLFKDMNFYANEPVTSLRTHRVFGMTVDQCSKLIDGGETIGHQSH